jgi:MerR family redox-sensitive transcriptional activator SoxR
MADMSIGEVARQAGVRPSTLRYYESIGLLPVPERRSGRRRYEPGVVHRLAIIQTAQQAGFSLDEIRMLFDDLSESEYASVRWRMLVDDKLQQLNVLMRNVLSMKALLEDIRSCADDELAECVYVTGQKHLQKQY